MNLDELYHTLKDRYQVEQEEKVAKEEAAKKEVEKNREELKSLITAIISTVRYEIENNMIEALYEAYKEARQKNTRAKKNPTVIICYLDENGIQFKVDINGYCSKIFEHHFDFDIMRQYKNNLIKSYKEKLREDECDETLYFSLDDNIVTFTEGNYCREFLVDVKEIFPNASVRYGNNACNMKFKLD